MNVEKNDNDSCTPKISKMMTLIAFSMLYSTVKNECMNGCYASFEMF